MCVRGWEGLQGCGSQCAGGWGPEPEARAVSRYIVSHTNATCMCGRLEGVDPQPEVEQSREGRVGAVFAESVHWREAVAVLQCVPKQGR